MKASLFSRMSPSNRVNGSGANESGANANQEATVRAKVSSPCRDAIQKGVLSGAGLLNN